MMSKGSYNNVKKEDSYDKKKNSSILKRLEFFLLQVHKGGFMSSRVVICGVDTSTLPKLKGKESEELLTRIKNGDERAREDFIVGNMRLVLSVIKRFRSKIKSSDDVFQAGCIGLIKAIDNFDLSFGVKFSTYAVPMMFV